MSGWGLLSAWRDSIRWKLVAALVAVSVLPMLLTSQIAASVVARTYTENVESWLFQISRFFLAAVERGSEDAAPLIERLRTSGRIERIVASARGGLAVENEPHLIELSGYDVLMVRDPGGRMLYSNRPIEELRTLPFEDGRQIHLFRGGGQTLLATGLERSVDTTTGPVEVFVGTFLDASFIEDIDAIGSLGLILYYNLDGSFQPVYASSPTAGQPDLDAGILGRLAALTPNNYLDASDSGKGSSIGIYLPIKDGGRLIGAIACSFKIGLGGLPSITSRGLLLVIFASGMTLAILAGIILSGLVTRRVGRLAEGVDAVAKGDFSQRIPVEGGDEFDRLGLAFNAMAEQLQDYRLLQARLRRKERFATLGEVAAGFAHEVRNPLGIIKTTAELVQRSPGIEAVDAHRLGYVADEVRRVDRLIRDFLIFARPAQRNTQIRPSDLLERVLGLWRGEIEARGVRLEVVDEAGDRPVSVDLDQMVQALLNLLLNALEAMDGMAPGMAVLSVRLAFDAAKGVVITVSDTGSGIAPDFLERIFDPFVTTKANGTGLGLATVFAIVESHGGWIEARNGPHGGAVFELMLPALPDIQ